MTSATSPMDRQADRPTRKSAPLISLRGVTKVYASHQDNDTVVLSNINLDIDRGSFTVIRGESGSGKTTLLRILGLLDSQFQGLYRFGPIEVQKIPGWQADEVRTDNIGFIFQDGRMFDHLTVRENIGLGLKLKSNISSAALSEHVDGLARRFLNPTEIEKGLLNNRPTQASGGQKQRAAIMRAFASEPMLILADEPTASLDEARKRDVLDMLVELNKAGHTIIVVSHDKVFQSYGTQIELSYGRLKVLHSEAPQPLNAASVVKAPPGSRQILNGWRPRARLSILLRQVWRDIVRRPTFALMIAAALAAGATQIGVLQSLLAGAQDYIDVAVTQGSRLNRLQIKPQIADLDQAIRFPVAEDIRSWASVEHVVARRQTLAKIVNLREERVSYVAMGLQDGDPEYHLLDFVAGTPFTAGAEELEVILTVTLVPELFADASDLASGAKTYSDFIGRTVQLFIPQFSPGGDLVNELPVNLRVVGIILAGEGGRQLYMPNRTSLAFDRFKMDRTGTLVLPLNATADGWTDRKALAQLQDFPWEDQLHIYTRQIRDIIPVFRQLSELGYKPQSDIWDFKWVLDIQALAQMISMPLLVLICLAVALTVWSNITASAKLQERELALWRILGMRRGDLVAMQIMATCITVLIGTGIGLLLAWSTVYASRRYLEAESTQPGVSAIFAPVEQFALLIMVSALAFSVIVAIWPAQKTARTDPAKVLSS